MLSCVRVVKEVSQRNVQDHRSSGHPRRLRLYEPGGDACCRRPSTGTAAPPRIAFPDTAYALPVILALVGKRVEKLGDLEEALQVARTWLPAPPTEKLWLPYLGGTLDAGAATLVAHEAVEAMKPRGCAV